VTGAVTVIRVRVPVTRGAPTVSGGGRSASGAIAVANTPWWKPPSNGALAPPKTGTATPFAANDVEM
jgi:hypothetical protein